MTNATPNIVKDHPHQRPGIWWALVKIDADPTATAQEVRDVMSEMFIPHPVGTVVQTVSIKVDHQWGLHPDEGSDENTVYWP